MLSTSAFNALLKTLEEPPPHVKFIFATTEVQKIPITILSRCQRFDFVGIALPRIVDRLRQIVASEGMQADEDALELVARRAGGSMRDAQSLLDQLLAFGGERLTADQVHRLLGTATDERVAALAGAVLQRDPKRALELLGQAADEGLQLGELLDQLIAYWRDLMVVNCAGEEGQTLSVAAQHRATLAQQATALKLDTILAGLDILVSTRGKLRTSNHGRILLEMALIRLGRLDDLVALAQLAQWLGQGPPAKSGAPAPAPRALTGAGAAAPRSAVAVQPPEAAKKKSLTAPETSGSPAAVALSAESLPQVWQHVLAQVGPMLANELRRGEDVAISGPNTLALRFPSRYNAAREYCQDPQMVAKLEQVLRQVTGRAWGVRFDTSSDIPDRVVSSPRDGAETETAPARSRRQRQEALQRPLLQRATDLLGAQIVQMDDGFGAAPAASPERTEPADLEEA
jgi:DNA polymerase-3 subunit gamma/tau